MNLPYIRAASKTSGMLTAFGGLNTLPSAGEGEFSQMTNLSARAYPFLQTRAPRNLERALQSPGGATGAGDDLIWADGTILYKNGVQIATVAAGEKQFARMGALLLVWPDKISVNLESGEVRALEHTYAASGSVSVSQSNLAGEASDTATFLKIAASGIGSGFSAWDGVEIAGLSNEALNGSYVLYAVEEDFLIVPGVLEEPLSQTGSLTVARTCPDMDSLAVHQNRLWGCSSENHEIYASKLGDPANFHVYAGIASDSYAATVGTAGDFTGAAAVNDTVVFFQEGGVTKVLGTKPANYQITFTPTSGVMRGSEKSLCLVDGTLFYLSPSGVCAYDGALAEKVSYKLDGWRLKNGVAGAADGRYLLSCQDEDGGAHLLVYDVASGLWHREDGLRAHSFANAGNVLYIFTADALYQANSGTEIFEWECVTGRMPLHPPGHKYVSRLVAQVELARGAHIEIAVRYEDSGPWRTVTVSRGARVVVANLPQTRAAFMRVRLRGRGGCTLESLARGVQSGTELLPWRRS